MASPTTVPRKVNVRLDTGLRKDVGRTSLLFTGVEWTILRANNFNQNFDENLWHAPLRAGRLALPMGDVPEPFVDVRDIADVAAKVLTSGGHHGRVYDLSGPRALTFAEAVATIASAAGREMRYEEVTLAVPGVVAGRGPARGGRGRAERDVHRDAGRAPRAAR